MTEPFAHPPPDPAADLQGPPRTLQDALERLAQREQELQALRAAQQEWLHAVSHDLRAPLRHVLSFGPWWTSCCRRPRLRRRSCRRHAASCRPWTSPPDAWAACSTACWPWRAPPARPCSGSPLPCRNCWSRRARRCWRSRAGRPAAAAARLQWSLPQQSPAVRADAALLRQVLEALLDNAVKFTQPVAQPRIAIDVERHADGGITLSVTDNGGGSTPRVRARCSASSSACTVSRSFRAWARAWPWCAASCAATAARPPSAPRPRAAAAYA